MIARLTPTTSGPAYAFRRRSGSKGSFSSSRRSSPRPMDPASEMTSAPAVLLGVTVPLPSSIRFIFLPSSVDRYGQRGGGLGRGEMGSHHLPQASRCVPSVRCLPRPVAFFTGPCGHSGRLWDPQKTHEDRRPAQKRLVFLTLG